MKGRGYQHVLLVGHGANFTASIRSLLGYEPAVLRSNGGLDNGSVTVLETFDFEQFSCIKWNDTYYKENKLFDTKSSRRRAFVIWYFMRRIFLVVCPNEVG